MKKVITLIIYFIIPTILNAERNLKFYLNKAIENNLTIKC